MRSDYISPELFGHILAALTPENSLALRVSLATGLRISDVLSIKTQNIEHGQRFTVTEQKTNKKRRIFINNSLYDEMLRTAGRYYVFENRLDARKHRTRQAVYKDLQRAAVAFRVSDALTVSPHTARKIYAVEALSKYGNPKKVQQLLQHSNEGVTMLYALADSIAAKKIKKTSSKSEQRSYR